MGLRFSEAVDRLRAGGKVRNGAWGPTDPSFLVLVPGRLVKASFEPMVNVIGEGNEFGSIEHIDAVFGTELDGKLTGATVVLGYNFRQSDLLNDAWFEV